MSQRYSPLSLSCNSLRTQRRRRVSPPSASAARYHDYIRFQTGGGVGRIPLLSPNFIGLVNSRGNRAYQQDFYGFATLSLNPHELQHTLRTKLNYDWDPSGLPEFITSQVHFIGLYDGHGGSTASQFSRQEFHALFENAHPSHIPDLYEWIKELGGYFSKRLRPQPLLPWLQDPNSKAVFDLEARATTAFFEVDRGLSGEKEARVSGATASIALLQTLDKPAPPFFAAENVALTVAHVGDTSVAVCATDGGVTPMTTKHHPGTPLESTRLRRVMGSGLVTDSFGEARWMGVLENTRSLGDFKYKPFGVTPEPEVREKLLKGSECSHIVLTSDGISSLVSHEEVNDLVRFSPTPAEGAKRVLAFAESVGSEDNATVIVIPLLGWGKPQGRDATKELRDYKIDQAASRRRM
ncbi:phosphatase 2C-like domain-containing protein [Thelephora terrestris]|uniref:Phosphatase 2C-like domain-containing protein n=1 Tax=Thelephora terrestris TaxID=56493 RepID=A0A9P6HKI7_9AGAM|nr:phosphatase 2C-like domain-containing protein [Thelephora terrestris]